MRSLFAGSIVCLVVCFGIGCADASKEATQDAETSAESLKSHGTVNGMPDDEDHAFAPACPMTMFIRKPWAR